jgi:phage-related protein
MAYGNCEATFRAIGSRDILFSVQQGKILILHGFIKKTQKTSDEDLALARKRSREFEP